MSELVLSAAMLAALLGFMYVHVNGHERRALWSFVRDLLTRQPGTLPAGAQSS